MVVVARDVAALRLQPAPDMDSAPLICFSHLRWDSVFQRPHHLMTRFARQRAVYFVEEPRDAPHDAAGLDIRRVDGVVRVVPQVPLALGDPTARIAKMLGRFFGAQGIADAVYWFYTPAALALADALEVEPTAVVYDCMDELSAFLGAPSALVAQERELFARADLVFTGGRSLFEAKRAWHPDVHCFPSSVDVAHFGQARLAADAPADQARLPRPRAGFFGVIDERLDLDLVAALAELRPQWSFVYVGPVVKIDPASLPARPNLHFVGQRPYAELPMYAAGWDVALMPFALNAATRYISPTKTLEYLAAGLPVVSTPIADVVDPYGALGLVAIARTAAEAAVALDDAAGETLTPAARRQRRAVADRYLDEWSWDGTWGQMAALVGTVARPVSGDADAAVEEPRRSA